jgi:aminoglycoside 6'-N-acetyltransferase I
MPVVSRRDSGVNPYAAMRAGMWSVEPEENRREIDEILRDQEHWAVFTARAESGVFIGFLEVGLREYAEGASTSPVGYLEGWYASPQFRNQGVGRALVAAGESWARSCGCAEMASDAEIDNALSIRLHNRLGYREVERIVCLLKPLKSNDS